MFRQVRILSRRFSTVNHYFEEHYQYPGNPTNEEFTKYFNENRKTYVQETTIYKPKGFSKYIYRLNGTAIIGKHVGK